MREGRRGRHDLGAGDIDAGIGLLLNGDEHVFDLIRRLGAIDRGIDDGMIHEQHVLLGTAIPGTRIGREPAVEAVIGPERVHQRGLVVGRAPHPPVGHARPLGDCVSLRDEFLPRAGRTEELMGIPARASVGRPSQTILRLGIVQRVIEPRDGARGVAERRMCGHVVDALAVDIDVTPIAQAREIFRAREWPSFGCNDVLGLHRPVFLAYAAPWHPRRKVSMHAPPAVGQWGATPACRLRLSLPTGPSHTAVPAVAGPAAPC